MREFYEVRSRDSAHDWDKVREVTRQKAVECKMWADNLINRDILNRSKKPSPPLIFEVHESPQGAVLTPKVPNNEPSN